MSVTTSSPGRTETWRARLAPLADLRRRAGVHWQRLAPRERRLVLLAGTAVAFALTWQLLLLPALDTTRTVSAALPALRADAARLDAIVAQARELQKRPGATASATAADLADSLARAGLQAHAEVTPEADGWRVRLAEAPVGAALAWLDDAADALRLRARDVTLERVADEAGAVLPGVVSGSVLLGGAGGAS